MIEKVATTRVQAEETATAWGYGCGDCDDTDDGTPTTAATSTKATATTLHEASGGRRILTRNLSVTTG